jgi:two-component system sensor histidine kinase HydH
VGGSLTLSFVANARALVVSSRSLTVAHEALVKRERLAALGELAAVVAHEVRNPLAVVFNATAGLRKTQPGSKDHEALLGIVQEEAERLRDIVSDLLEFARPRPPHFVETEIAAVVRGAIESARAEAGASEPDVSLEVKHGVSPTSCDERLVRQAVINLVTNALHAPGRRGPVRVTLEPAGADGDGERDARDGIVLCVADDGAGVPEELRERVFTPFYSTRPRGTGLGLAVVKSSAEAHGGDVSLTTTPGGGATFRLRLPRRGEPASETTQVR